MFNELIFGSILQMTVDDFFNTLNSSRPVENRAGLHPLSDADRPFPSCRVSRLNDGVRDTPVFHDHTWLFASGN
jgi:hypothetical protein